MKIKKPKSNNINDTVSKVKTLYYDKSVWHYEQSFDKTARYILGTKGKKTLLCFGVNPSTASPNDTDKTIANVSRFANTHGYDSYIMLNLYPQRATDPNDMDDEVNRQYEADNFETIRAVFALLQNEQGQIDIWSAWGTLITKRDYLKSILKEIVRLSNNYNCNWLSMGEISKDGHPHHPLYLAKDLRFDEFDINTYLTKICGRNLYLGEFSFADKKRFLTEINSPKNRIIPQGDEVVFLDDATEEQVDKHFAINPMTDEKLYKNNIIISYGYSDAENKTLQEKLPKDCKLLVTDYFTDVLAVPSVYQFVNPLTLSKEEMEQLATYWVDISTVY